MAPRLKFSLNCVGLDESVFVRPFSYVCISEELEKVDERNKGSFIITMLRDWKSILELVEVKRVGLFKWFMMNTMDCTVVVWQCSDSLSS